MTIVDTPLDVTQPFDLRQIQSFEREGIELWNWFSACFPGCSDWSKWVAEVAGQLIRQPRNAKTRLVRTNLANPSQAAERIVLDVPEAGIGRDLANHIVLPEATVTRRHAVLKRSGDTYLLEDLGSAMGTLAAGSKLAPGTPIELSDGSEFVIFPYRFQLEIEREWSAGGEVEITQPYRTACSTGEFARNCPAGWIAFPVHVDPLGKQALIALDSRLLEDLIQSLLAPIELPSVGLDSFRDAWLELLMLSVVERANRDLKWPLRLSLGRRVKAAVDTDDVRGIALSTTLRLGSMKGTVAMMLPFPLIEAMKNGDARPRRGDVLASRAIWRFAVTCGSVELTSAEQATIEAGDVVLYQPRSALLRPGNDASGFEVRWIDDARLEIHKAFDRRMMTNDSQEPLSAFQDLPLRVEILIAEQEMTLAQAEMLAPGSVIDLERDPRDPVRLAVNGKVIGTGELVDIQGRLGVKILEWSKR